jgi:hypothetical protein
VPTRISPATYQPLACEVLVDVLAICESSPNALVAIGAAAILAAMVFSVLLPMTRPFDSGG